MIKERIELNKILLLNIFTLLFIACEKKINKQNTYSVLDTSKVKKTEPLLSKINYLEKIQNKSFVISCGSGCAMTYTAEQIIKEKSSIKVKFKVEMYINEVLSDTYEENYLFIYDTFNGISKILFENTKRDALETLPTGAQKSFRDFSKELINYLGVNNGNIQENKYIIGKNLVKIGLPFSFYQYFKDDYSSIKYPTYEPTSNLIEFLKNENYEGESYKSFVIRCDDEYLYLITSISRGDSEYFLLITSDKSKIIDFKEIGSIGGDDPITFKVLPNFTLEMYNGNEDGAIPFKKFKITTAGKIVP